MRRKQSVEITLRWLPDSPLHVGSGRKGGGFLDHYLVRDSSGRPMIPGSTVKGRVRAYTLMAYRTLGGTGHREGEPCGCPVCRLFGSPGASPGSLMFGDLRLEAGEGEGVLVKAAVAIDRYTRRPRENHLLFAEQAWAPADAGAAAFAGLVEGFVAGNSDGVGPEELLGLLGTGIRLVRALGWSKSRGLGHGRFAFTLRVDGQPVSDEEWRRWAEAWES